MAGPRCHLRRLAEGEDVSSISGSRDLIVLKVEIRRFWTLEMIESGEGSPEERVAWRPRIREARVGKYFFHKGFEK